MRGFMEFVCVLLVIAVGTLAVLAVVVASNEYATARGKIAAIEQLREDALHVRGAESAGVMQLVAQANGQIAFYKALNAQPFVGWTIPNEWAAARPIRMRTLRDVEPEPPGVPPTGGGPARNYGYTPNAVESERFIRSLQRATRP